jgi:ribosomal protein L40E
MTEESQAKTTARISSFVLVVVFITLALSLVALILATTILGENSDAAWIMFVMGLLGVAISTYVLVETRRRISKLRIVVPPVTTTIECKKCGYKNVREFQRGDFIFKEGEKCQKCNENMLITAIYREVKEKPKEKQGFPF